MVERLIRVAQPAVREKGITLLSLGRRAQLTLRPVYEDDDWEERNRERARNGWPDNDRERERDEEAHRRQREIFLEWQEERERRRRESEE